MTPQPAEQQSSLVVPVTKQARIKAWWIGFCLGLPSAILFSPVLGVLVLLLFVRSFGLFEKSFAFTSAQAGAFFGLAAGNAISFVVFGSIAIAWVDLGKCSGNPRESCGYIDAIVKNQIAYVLGIMAIPYMILTVPFIVLGALRQRMARLQP
ncbi:hypothetical protein BJ742DRAFT_768504 [Cladochytrium replicatum]|nr:hypothetical protein BJ742DRAFT_768504 [Cladochytrium replicatum]